MAGATSRANGKKGGRPKGKKSQKTLFKEAMLEAYRQKVMHSADLLFQKQLHLACGQTYLYKIEKELQIGPKGGKRYVRSKPKLVTSQREIEAYLQGQIVDGDIDNENDPSATYYFLTAKDPDGRAIDSMLDRAFGKSAQTVDLSNKDREPFLIKWMT